MKNYTIPAILVVAIIAAGAFAFAPIDQATAVHNQIIDTITINIAANNAQVITNGGDVDVNDAETVTFSCDADYLLYGITLDMGPGTYGTGGGDDVSVTIDGDEIATSVTLGPDVGGAVAILDGGEAATANTLTILDFNLGVDDANEDYTELRISVASSGACAFQ